MYDINGIRLNTSINRYKLFLINNSLKIIIRHILTKLNENLKKHNKYIS